MTTRADIRTKIRRELRDPLGKSWSNDEINDLINSGINAVSDLSPLEKREDITYMFPYALRLGGALGKIKEITPVTPFYNVFRVEVLDQHDKLHTNLPINNGFGSSTGWEFWNGKVLIPEMFTYPSVIVEDGPDIIIDGENLGPDKFEEIKVRIFGYARHDFLESDEDVATVSEQEESAVRVYAVAEALSRLMIDRANFQQWQIASGSSDVTISELAVLANSARQRWFQERGRLRKMRRLA